MPKAINTYLVEHGQAPLSAPVAFARCIMESLVLLYHEVFHSISRRTGTIIHGVHVLSGGARNARLNQWLADALDVPVIAGPFEATALGNELIQLVGLGELHSLEEVRAIVQHVPTRVFSPQWAGTRHRVHDKSAPYSAWNEAAQRFSAMSVV